MYVIKSIRSDERWWSTHLFEMTKAEYLQTVREASPHEMWRQVTPSEAHAWVRSDRPHSTNLWLDGDRIRRA